MLSKDVRLLVEKLEHILPPDIFLWEEKNKQKTINKNPAFNLLALFLTEIIHLLEDESSLDHFSNLFFRKENYAFNKPGEESLSGGIMAWLQKYYLTQGNYKPQIMVEELPNDDFKISVGFANDFGTETNMQPPNAIP